MVLIFKHELLFSVAVWINLHESQAYHCFYKSAVLKLVQYYSLSSRKALTSQGTGDVKKGANAILHEMLEPSNFFSSLLFSESEK